MIRNPATPDPWALTRNMRALIKYHPAPYWGEVITTTGEWPTCSASFVVPHLVSLILSTTGDEWSLTVLGGTALDDALRMIAQCDKVPRGPVELLSERVADCLQLRGGTCDTFPPWLADPVRRELRRRAGELLTLAGSSPADVVSAAETVDEALCTRAPVECSTNGILAALQAIGMSCRWVKDPEPVICDRCGDPSCGERMTCREFGR